MKKRLGCLLLALPTGLGAAAADAVPEPAPIVSAEAEQAFRDQTAGAFLARPAPGSIPRMSGDAAPQATAEPAPQAPAEPSQPVTVTAPTYDAGAPDDRYATPVEQFVARFYENVLDRDPDSEGFVDWVGRLNSGSADGAIIAEGFFCSAEVAQRGWSDEEYLRKLYQTILGREADAAGLADWLGQLADGMTWRYALRGFVESAEFAALCEHYGILRGMITLSEPREQNVGVTRFVSRCYRLALGRAADVEGLNDWTGRLLSHREVGSQVAYGFIFSDEFFGNDITWGDYIRLLYRMFFGREEDAAGFNYWAQAVEDGIGMYDLFLGFANSAEFSNLCAQYGIEAGAMPAWEPVPISRLANYPSVKKRASDAQFAEAYQVAAQISRRYANMPREQQLYGIAIDLRTLYDNEMEYSMSAPNYDDPYGFFVRHVASCAGCTRATGLCLNQLGIPYEHVNENGYTHQWCRVPMPDGTHWICDAYGLACGPEPAPYRHPYL